MAEEQEGTSEAQVIEGYGCICGFVTGDMHEFRVHVMRSAARDGKGTHKSLGRVNLQTGEVLMGPWKKRTRAEKRASSRAKRGKRTEKEGAGEEGIGEGTGEEGTGKDGKKPAPIRTTDVLADATTLKFVPRVYTTDYSPIMRAGLDAAIEFWGWRKDMPLGNFLDTVLHMFFKEHGIHLAGYTISDEARKAIEADKQEEVIT